MPTPLIAVWNIVGTSPLIQGNPEQMWAEPEEEPEPVIEDGKKATPTKKKKKRLMYPGKSEAFKIAESTLYKNDEGRFYHPTQAFFHALFEASKDRELGVKVQARGIIVQAVSIVEQEFLLHKPETLATKKPKLVGPKDWLVDKRRALNHNTTPPAGVVAIRGKWKAWGGLLAMEVDCDVFAKDENGIPELGGLTDLLTIAGVAFGVGVGRRIIKKRDQWGRPTEITDMGMGRFKAELRG